MFEFKQSISSLFGTKSQVDHEEKQKKDKEVDKKDKSLLKRLMSGDEDAKNELVQNASQQTSNAKNTQQQKQVREKMTQDLMKKLYGEESYDDGVTLSKTWAKSSDQNFENDQEIKKSREKLTRLAKEIEDEVGGKNAKKPEAKGADKTAATVAVKDQDKRIKQSSEQEAKGKQTLVKYSESFLSYMVTKSPQEKQKMEEAKKDLRNQGFSSKSLLKMEESVGEMVRQHVTMDIRKKLLDHYFSYSGKTKSGVEMAKNSLDKLVNSIKGSDQLGGENFGNYKGGIENLVQEEGWVIKNEIKQFIFDQAVNNYVEHTIDGDSKKLEEKQYMLQRLMYNSTNKDFHTNEIIIRIQKTIDQLGLTHFIPPENANQSLSYSEGDPRGNEKKSDPMKYISQEEKLEEELRQLYMMRILNPGIKDQLEMMFKMKKTKNGLIKLGIQSEDFFEKMRAQGEFLAKAKLIEEYQQACREQATLHELKGPSYDIIKQKKSYCIKSLRKLGERITSEQLKRFQDDANRELFPVLREQLYQLEMKMDISSHPGISRKHKSLKETLERIKEESGIKEEISLNIGGKPSGFNQKNITEAA